MIERKRFPTDRAHCELLVTTEQLPSGRWAVVVSVSHASSPDTVKVIDLPVSDETFNTAPEAEEFGHRLGQEWVERNMPSSASA
jgi:hypothetical protein